MKRGVAVLAGVVAGLLLAGTAEARKAPPPPGDWWTGYLEGSRLVKLPDGRKINLYCEGHGAPLVVLDSGLGDGASSWRMVQDQIAARTRVCAYDRAGYGRSTPGPEPRDSRALAADLAATLQAAREPGPYILVGHSLASFNLRLFAFEHRGQVAGMVLVDPSADRQFDRMTAVVPRVPDILKAADVALPLCARSPRPGRLEKVCVRSPPADAPPEAADLYAQAQGPDYYRTQLSEQIAFEKTDSKELMAARRSLGTMPLVILTAGANTMPGLSADETAAIRKVWTTMHDEMAELSRRGVNRVVPDVTHYIHQQRPDIVLGAVFEVLDATRR
jgi:pimeloyl-ACP methyl ester carboxylesterase